MDINRQLSRNITTIDGVWTDWLKVGFSYSLAIATIAAVSLNWENINSRAARIFLPMTGIASTIYGLNKTRQLQLIEPTLQYRKTAQQDITAHTVAAQTVPYLEQQNQLQLQPAGGVIQETGDRPYPFDVQSFLDEVTGVAILGNSGSGKTQLAKYIANACGETQVLVLDPHADIEDEHYPWDGLTVISDKAKILKQLEKLLGLLDRKDKTPLVIICDEYPAIRAYANKVGSDVANEFILRYGSEARKFKKLPIFISQSGNVKSFGLDGQGDFLENFALIRLQKIACKYLKNSPDRELYQMVKVIAYPMLIGDDEIVIHPTHGGYTQARKNLPPQNLKQLVSMPLTIPLVDGIEQLINLQKQPPTVAPKNRDLDYYERCFSLELDLGDTTSYPQPPNQQPNQLQPLQDNEQPSQPVRERVDPFAPVTGETQQLVKRLLSEGWSQNKLVFEVFKVGSKGSKAYYQAVNIIKGIESI
ncbi:ATP-binding protein [[Limnothrix rosea] IAM M-220]|uniref:ATP-binding protein n=1 Tax=[Limnothrix rosea] IAM M-220 TaxID=454133 RepID=UPI0009682422|nr:ATP-binding protein [[Limnothrix rosea] IAM M-220]OKH12311.1 hypothetical protein NIES208_16320 [[Limnothrix rosea] IAM M-220]